MVDTLVEGWVRKCYKCGGVMLGPPLDDGVIAIEREAAVWSCQNCGHETEYDEHDPQTEVRLWEVTTERVFLRKARLLEYSEFMSWVNELEDS